MTAPAFAQFGVYPYVTTGANASTGYIIMMTPTVTTPLGVAALVPPDPTIQYLGYASYAAMITALGLQASKNFAAYPYAYVVGSSANTWTTAVLALAAAESDCNLIVTQRNTNIANSGINASNPYVTIGAPVLGPL